MPRLSDIRGQDRAVAIARRAIEQNRVPNGYLFAGPEGAGKYTTALAVAAALNCLEHPGEGCDTCEACSKIAGGIHPDIRTLSREGAAQIVPIETIRREVLAQVGLPPHEARARVYLLEEAGAMQEPAANALLKTLEEPPARTHFILITTAPDQLLPTIRSRCQRISFAELPPELRAQVADDPEGAARLEGIVDRLRAAVDAGDAIAIHEAASGATQEKSDLVPVLQALAHRLHREARQAAVEGDGSRARALSRGASIALETQVAVSLHNAHGQLAFDGLLRRLRHAGAMSARVSS